MRDESAVCISSERTGNHSWKHREAFHTVSPVFARGLMICDMHKKPSLTLAVRRQAAPKAITSVLS